MKVLHIMASLLPSGAETMLACSAGAWDKGLEKHILATAQEVGPYAATLEKAGYIIHHIHCGSYWKQHRAVRKLMRAHKFDVVHQHMQAQAFSYTLDARLTGAKRILRTVHNVFVFRGPVQVREFLTRQLACLIGVKHVSIGPSVHENEWKRFRVRCAQVPNWFDENRFSFTSAEQKRDAREALGIPRDAFCLISVGNCTPVKNHMAILSALACHRQTPGFDKVLYLHLGHGPQEEAERCFVREQGIDHLVRFVGFEDPVPYLRAADLYVMPSTYEGLGISAMEAAATGMPALLTDVPGLRDLKALALPGLRYCPLEDAAIAEGIARAVAEGPRENDPRQAEKIRQTYGISRGVTQYQALYRHK